LDRVEDQLLRLFDGEHLEFTIYDLRAGERFDDGRSSDDLTVQCGVDRFAIMKLPSNS
jgi:hypothetical protein